MKNNKIQVRISIFDEQPLTGVLWAIASRFGDKLELKLR